MPGTTNNAFAYDDRLLASAAQANTQNTEFSPPMPGGTNWSGSGGETNAPMGPTGPVNYGTNLYLLIGPLTNQQAWLVLTNTHKGSYYQLESRPQVNGGAWALGQIVKDTGTAQQIGFSNVPTYYPAQMFFRGVGGNTVASIGLDPDYNLAVQPALSGGTGQSGKFTVSLSPPVSSAVTVAYQVSGSASNGVDYSSLSGTVTVGANAAAAAIPLDPLYAALPMSDKSVTLTLVLSNGYVVNPQSASATMKIYPPRPAGMAVAIHDSGWTKLNGLSTTNWNYFVMPESVKEALRSDGTPYVVVSDLDIANGVLTNANGSPTYPILISLAAEAIRDEEIAPLTNYVAAGGFILAGSSSFTRSTNGGFRSDFALASQMGVSCNPSAANWYANTNLLKLTNHVLVDHIPDGPLTWRMPTSADEISWGTCLTHSEYCDLSGFYGTHLIWQVTTNSAVEELAWGDTSLYLAVNPYGSGYFIYDAALQPLIGHGGFAPGMYAYVIFRRAIEWAFASAQRPVVRLSPWPYQYDAAFMVRHDLENYVVEIQDVSTSAQYENSYGAKGDYYFCTGAITNQNVNTDTIVAGLQYAVANYGATISSHNGGLPNPSATTNATSCCDMNQGSFTYEYFHWGPDEALDLPGGYDDASNSLATSFAQIEGWLTNYQTNSPRLWVAPYFNATREGSYQIEEQLNIQITGDQKLTPFPAFTLSTQTDGKRYALLSEPVSDWFVGGLVAQSLEPWHPPGVQTPQTLSNAVDFYYTNGFLINFYSHTLAASPDDPGDAGVLVPDYILYCANAQIHPRLWAANARGVYQWWLNRSTAQVTASSGTNNGQAMATIAIAGAQDPNTAVELFISGVGAAVPLQVLTNGVAAGTNVYRANGQVIKVWVGTSVTNVQVQYVFGPQAQDDSYSTTEGQALTVAAPGVLANDFPGTWPGLSAILNGGPSHGTLAWDQNLDGGFTYTPTNGFWGTDCFTYQATDGQNNFGTATVTISVTATNGATTDLYSDDFVRCKGTAMDPWQVYAGQWSLGGGVMQGSSPPNQYVYCYINTNWTSYSVEASVQFPAGGYGGGLGGCLNPSTGAHYAAWIYPQGAGGTNVLKLVKFLTWEDWGTNGANNHIPLAMTNLPPVGADWHPLKLAFNGNNIDVYFDGTNVISTTDTETQWYTTGGVSLDMWTDTATYTMSLSNVIVAPYP